MFEKIILTDNKEDNYIELIKITPYILDNGINLISNLANASALLNYFLKEINWVGFYLFENDKLILGPFQGEPACTKIEIGNGVCGSCAKDLRTYIVDDVSKFPTHIACDSSSKSEIVIPIKKNNKLFGVLDIDSPILSRFDNTDKIYLEKFVKNLAKIL